MEVDLIERQRRDKKLGTIYPVTVGELRSFKSIFLDKINKPYNKFINFYPVIKPYIDILGTLNDSVDFVITPSATFGDTFIKTVIYLEINFIGKSNCDIMKELLCSINYGIINTTTKYFILSGREFMVGLKIGFVIRRQPYSCLSDIIYHNMYPNLQYAFYKNGIYSSLLGKHYILTGHILIDPMLQHKHNMLKQILYLSLFKKEILVTPGMLKVTIPKVPIIKKLTKFHYDFDLTLIPLKYLADHLLMGYNYHHNVDNKIDKKTIISNAKSIIDTKSHKELSRTFKHNIIKMNGKYIRYPTNRFTVEDLKNLITLCEESDFDIPPIDTPIIIKPWCDKKNSKIPYFKSRLIYPHVNLILSNRYLFIFICLKEAFIPTELIHIILKDVFWFDCILRSKRTKLAPWLKNKLSNQRSTRYVMPKIDNEISINELIGSINNIIRTTRGLSDNLSMLKHRESITLKKAIIEKYESVGHCLY